MLREGDMKNGLYKVTFQSSRGSGTGVIVLNDGRLLGGNAASSFVGTYRTVERSIIATIATSIHTPMRGQHAVLGVADADIALSGSITADGARLCGSSPLAAGIKLQVALEFLAA